METTDTLKALAAMSVLWPSYRLPENELVLEVAVAAAHRQWAGLDAEAVMGAIDTLSAEGSSFAPTVGQVAQRATELVDRAMGTRVPDPDEAWAEVRMMIQRRGQWAQFTEDPLAWSHPLVGDTVERIGWKALCEGTNEVADRAHFAKMYEQARRRSQDERIAAPVAASLAERLRVALGDGEGPVGHTLEP